MKIDKVTVLMTVYNGADYIGQAIESILCQSFANYEFLIIDDGSTDNTGNVVHSFKDNRIRYLSINHCGYSKALNFGLRNAKNDWVAIMDADDIAHPERLEKQLNFIGKENNSICSTWSIYFKESRLLFAVETPIEQTELKKKLNLHSYICHSGLLYNRNYILENKGYSENLEAFSDYDLWLRIKETSNFYIIPEYLMFIRVLSNSNSRIDFFVKRKNVYDLQQCHILNNKEQLNHISSSELRVYNGWREYFYGDRKKAVKEWLKSKSEILKDYRIFIAILISFLPEKILFQIKEFRIRLRVKLMFNKTINKEIAKQIISGNFRR